MLVCVHHLEPPAFAYAQAPLAKVDAEIAHVHPRRGEPLPDPAGLTGIVSFGAEESVLDVGADRPIAGEARWLERALESGVPVLGVCFGAQLLAHVLGGEVRRLPKRTLVWAPVRPTPAAQGDPVAGSIPPSAHALHWNEDGFDLPPGAVELFARELDSCMGFRHGDSAWGVQFHPEADAGVLDEWYSGSEAWLASAGVTEQQARAADATHLPGQAALADAIFAGFAGVVRARRLQPSA